MRRLTFQLLAVIISLAALIIVPASQAFADQSAPTLSPTQGPPGTSVTASASDWVGCSSMSVSGWGTTLGTASINSSGAFSLPFTVPASAPVGAVQLQFSPTCSHSAWMPFVTFTVTSAPSVSWTSPVGNSGTFNVSSGSVTLAASASDDVGVARVVFTRWDAVGQKLVTLATLTHAPWQTSLNVGTLNGQWNQINVQAWDAAGNASSAPYIWIYRNLPSAYRLTVPFATQMGSAGDPNSGSNNCGPASITMAILFYGGSTTVPAAAVAIRGSNALSNGPTDFKSSSAQAFLAEFSLLERNVTTWDQVRGEISAGRPVVILVNNYAYRYLTPPPYPNDSSGWFTTSHIVVVTGYDSTNVYVNDPLRSGPDYAIPVATFMNAASTAPGTSSSNWYAVSIGRGP